MVVNDRRPRDCQVTLSVYVIEPLTAFILCFLRPEALGSPAHDVGLSGDEPARDRRAGQSGIPTCWAQDYLCVASG
jgi:hypothetical protein